jgi:hypothetical protein
MAPLRCLLRCICSCVTAVARCLSRDPTVTPGVPAAGGLASILLWGAKGSRALKLPITVGPLKGGEKVRAHPAACSYMHCEFGESGVCSPRCRAALRRTMLQVLRDSKCCCLRQLACQESRHRW